jgi:hypothetical protein
MATPGMVHAQAVKSCVMYPYNVACDAPYKSFYFFAAAKRSPTAFQFTTFQNAVT